MAANPAILYICIFGVSFVLRLLAPQVPINIDETDWMRFSLHFVKSLLQLDLAETYQWHHPGVTNMWINGMGQSLYCLFHNTPDVPQSSLKSCIQSLLDQRELALSALVIARVLQALVTSACIVYLFSLAKRLFGTAIALLGIGLLTFEPFFLAYQRLVVTDALQVNFLAIATLLLLLYLRGDGDRTLLIQSGIGLGLAVATKTPTLTILPAIAVWLALIELGVWRSRFPTRGILRQATDMAAWGATGLATFIVIFPAMWVEPFQTVGRLATELRAETERGYFFFMGALTDSPGALFYPLVLLYRLSPVLLLGILLGIVALIVPKWRRSLSHPVELTALVLVSASVLLVLSGSDNKIDRYILPTLPALAFLSAAGWLWALNGLSHSLPLKHVAATVGGLLVLIQVAIAAPHYPYYLTFFNPLLGGASSAQRLLMIGNGEGLDQAAHWLDQTFQPGTITVGSWYSPSFKPYSHHRTVEIGRKMSSDRDRRWLYDANYLVFYINQRQRQLPSPEILSYFTAQPPLHTISLHGVDYVQIYPGTIARPEDLATVHPVSVQLLGDAARLRGYDVARSSDPEYLTVTLYWEMLRPLPSDPIVAVKIKGRDRPFGGRAASPITQGILSTKFIKPGMLIRDVHSIPLAVPLLDGTYTLDVGWFSKESIPSDLSNAMTSVGEFTAIAKNFSN